MFWKRKTTNYLEWDEYHNKIAVWEAISFSQRTRKVCVRNMPGLAEQL